MQEEGYPDGCGYVTHERFRAGATTVLDRFCRMVRALL